MQTGMPVNTSKSSRIESLGPEKTSPLIAAVDSPRGAVVAIDLHRGHLDMSVATMPCAPEIAERVIAANDRLFSWCRRVGVPVIHLVTQYRDAEEIRANPAWRVRADDPKATRKNVLRHNLMGMPGCEIIPRLQH